VRKERDREREIERDRSEIKCVKDLCLLY